MIQPAQVLAGFLDAMALVGIATTIALWLWAVKAMLQRRTAGSGGEVAQR